MSIKRKRLRGSNTHGRGYSKSKNGSRGGVGRAGTKTHKRFSRILEQKKLIKNKKVVNLKQIESKLELYKKKKFLTLKKVGQEFQVTFESKFYNNYKKVLGTGEPSCKYKFDTNRIQLSKSVKLKLE